MKIVAFLTAFVVYRLKKHRLSAIPPVFLFPLSLPDTFPRLQILTDMSKSFIDSSGIDAYEASKAETHRRIKERHQRHQSRRKRAKQEVVEEAVGSSAGDSANEKQEEEQTIKPCVD